MFTALFLKIDRSRFDFADALRNFDPVNDWLLSETSYLTWRKWGQQLPGDSEPIALMKSQDGFVIQPKDWMGEEFLWMAQVMSGGSSDAGWRPSNYRGLLGHAPSMSAIEAKLLTYNAFLAPSEDQIETTFEFPERYFRGFAKPYLLFYVNGQVRGLYNQPPWMHAEVTWRNVLPQLVEGIKRYQSDQLAATV